MSLGDALEVVAELDDDAIVTVDAAGAARVWPVMRIGDQVLWAGFQEVTP